MSNKMVKVVSTQTGKPKAVYVSAIDVLKNPKSVRIDGLVECMRINILDLHMRFDHIEELLNNIFKASQVQNETPEPTKDGPMP